MTRIVIQETLFGAQRRSMEEVIRSVTREAKEECDADCCALAGSLDTCARQTVAALWPSRVRSFVPLLALRGVRECISAGRCPSTPDEN